MASLIDRTLAWREWTTAQRHTLVAGVGAWTLDSFDYFILVFVLDSVQSTFAVSNQTIAFALTLTLLMRPLGAAIFGPLAERFGRKPILISNIVIFAAIELLTAVVPSYGAFLALRGIYGVAMGGVWGVSSALTFETVPTHVRGPVSGIFQAGYPGGYLIASVVNLLLAPVIGWRGMFAVGAIPVLLAVYIAIFVRESPVWLAHHGRGPDGESTGAPSVGARESAGAASAGRPGASPRRTLAGTWRLVARNWRVVVFGLLLMSAFNFFSHGSQDLYPGKFLAVQHGLAGHAAMSVIPIFSNIAAMAGGIVAGALSERFGRKRMIMVFAAGALPFIPLWAGASTPVWLGVGAFLVQFAVQGAWGIVPTYLNELFPEGTRAVLPGVVSQLGNVIASPNANIQVAIAMAIGTAAAPNFGAAMAIVTACVAVLLVAIVSFGPETRGRSFLRVGARHPAPAR